MLVVMVYIFCYIPEGLKSYFAKYGEVVGVDIKVDAVTGRPR